MKFRIFLFILAIMAMGNCDDDVKVAELLTNGNNKFTTNLFSEVARNNIGNSFVLSPFSVLTPLAQLTLASEGKSHDELLRAIGLPSDESIISVFSYINEKFRSFKGIDLKMATKIYAAQRYILNDNYAEVSRDIFQSEFVNIDFTNSLEASEEINTWVEGQTNHRIKDLVDPNDLSADTIAILVNAIYFKGTWKDPFLKELTRDSEFHISHEKSVKVQMMYREGDFYYIENEKLKAKILGIPFKGDESVFYIILPNDIGGLTELKDQLKDPSSFNDALKITRITEVQAFIPKFRIETITNLKKMLSNIGVEKLFKPNEANINKLFKNAEGFHISGSIQKAFIEINEEGGEAAAANEFAIETTSLSLNVRRFVADHPFVFILKTGQDILFNGVFSP